MAIALRVMYPGRCVPLSRAHHSERDGYEAGCNSAAFSPDSVGMAHEVPSPDTQALRGQRVALVGKLAGMSKRDAQQLIRRHGGTPQDVPDASASLIVIGEQALPLPDPGGWAALIDDQARAAAERGALEVITETQLWQRLGLVDDVQHVQRFYTPAMLADLLGVPLSVIRRWQRRGLIVPVREVRRLAYFDFQEIATARRLAELLSAGVSPQAIEQQLAALARWLPGVERPLSQLSVIVEGKDLLLRQGEGLVDTGGQLRLDFEASAARAQGPGTRGSQVGSIDHRPPITDHRSPITDHRPPITDHRPATTAELVRLAMQADDAGELEAAAEIYRVALAAGGPDAVICFCLAELLYRLGDLGAARERYYMVIELDENYVEARANLGCVLAETGQLDLAVSAFEGALACHGDYPDAHYHLARALDELGRRDEAETHWRRFLELAPDSPWATQAADRLGR